MYDNDNDNLVGHDALKHRCGTSLLKLALYTISFLAFLPHPSLCRQVFTRPTLPVSAGLCLKSFERHLPFKVGN
jgi:hypothetical protein